MFALTYFSEETEERGEREETEETETEKIFNFKIRTQTPESTTTNDLLSKAFNFFIVVLDGCTTAYHYCFQSRNSPSYTVSHSGYGDRVILRRVRRKRGLMLS